MGRKNQTFNPVTGCLYGCGHCNAARMAERFAGNIRANKERRDCYRTIKGPGNRTLYILDEPMRDGNGKRIAYPFGFEPTFHRYRLGNPGKLKNKRNIFVGTMGDMFGDWVPDEWIAETEFACERNPGHNYIFLTSNPGRYAEHGVPAGKDNMWYGASVTKESEMGRFNSLPAGCKVFVSMDPVSEDLNPYAHNLMFRQTDWIVLGTANGKRQRKLTPKPEWITDIVKTADNHKTPVFMKDGLAPIVGEENMRREYPPELE